MKTPQTSTFQLTQHFAQPSNIYCENMNTSLTNERQITWADTTDLSKAIAQMGSRFTRTGEI